MVSIRLCKRQSGLYPNCNPLEPERLQRDSPATCVIAQQYSSATFVSQPSYSRKEKTVLFSALLLFQFYVSFYCLSLKLWL
jgi:hypothetical protein